MTPVAAPVDRSPGSTAFEITAAADGRSLVRGALTFPVARKARSEGLAKFRQCGARSCEVDCSGITRSDSAGLSVLLDWLALAKRDGRSLRYLNLPQELLAIAKISEVAELLQKGV